MKRVKKCIPKDFLGPKILIPAVRVKTAKLTEPKFPTNPFFEKTRRKVLRIKKFKKGHQCIPVKLFKTQKF